MHPSWTLLLAILLGQALSGPGIEPSARVSAGVGFLLLAAAARRRTVLLLVGALLGGGLGLELRGRVDLAEDWEGYRGPVRLQLTREGLEGRAEAWLRAPELAPQRAYVSGLDEGVEELGARGVAEARAWLPASRRNPDDRNRRRGALVRGTLVRARILGPVREESAPPDARGDPRRAVAAALRARLQPHLGEGTGIWMALLLGEREGLSEEAQARFRDLGLAHLLALSGLHVGLLAALLLKALRTRLRSRRAIWVLPPLLLWAWAAGMGPSLFRAVFLLSWLLVGRRCRREARAVDGLALAGVMELLWRPESVCGLAWWLSYAATLALLRAAEWRLRPRWISLPVVVCLAPLATSPWVLSAFGRVPLAGPLWNLLVGPVFALFMALGVAAVLLSILIPVLAPSALTLLALLDHGLGWMLRTMDAFDPGAFGHPALHGIPWALTLAAIGLLLIPGMPGGPRRRAACVLFLLSAVHLPLLRPAAAVWWSLDVGQGDGGVLRVGRRGWLAVDAGNGPFDGGEERVVLPYLRRRNASGVELLISHGHRDHCGGAASLLRSGRVSTLHLAACERGRSWTFPLLELAYERGVRVSWLRRGDRWKIGAWTLRCLWPPAVNVEEYGSNDRSLVIRAGPPGAELLLTGDLEREAELSLLGQGDTLAVKVLKVAHHGSRTGTGPALLSRLGSGWALISCGVGNRYGHPHAPTLEALRSSGWELLRTDLRGAVGVIWTRNGVEARSTRPPP